MRSKLSELVVEPQEPFQNCKLGREPYAEVLTQIVSNYHDGCVLSVNGGWGSGKTTFVKMWKQFLENNQFKTLYFNVWEHDFLVDPLVGLIGELCKLDSNKDFERGFIKSTAVLMSCITSAFPLIMKGVAKKFIGDEAVEAVEATVSTATEYVQKQLNSYTEQCDAIEEFRATLESYVAEYTQENPLVFIVDELDRCNPTYAVKVLERIKHLFNIPNIVFVLSVDKEQLCNSIRGYYGSDLINAEEYLKRFIDVEYNLPEPDAKAFCGYLYDAFGIEAYFNKIDDQFSHQHRDFNDKDSFVALSIAMQQFQGLTLRDMEKMYSHIRLVLQSVPDRTYFLPEVVLLMVYFRAYDSNVYHKIRFREYTLQELVDVLEDKLPFKSYMKSESQHFDLVKASSCAFARLLAGYDRDETGSIKEPLLKEIDGKNVLSFKSKYFNDEFMVSFMQFYRQTNSIPYYHSFNRMFDYIELVKRLQQ